MVKLKSGAFIGLLLNALQVFAEENAVGHWIPGQMPFLAGMIPPEQGLYFRESNYFIQGLVSDVIGVPIGNEVVFNSQRTIYVDTFVFNYVMAPKRTEVWMPNYSFVVVAPFMYLKNSVTLTPIGFAASEASYNLSDMTFTPLNLGWDYNDFHWTTSLNIYAPTGPYSVSSLAPSGYNYWTFEPALGFTYFEPHYGLEGTFYAAVDFNTINYATDYKTGDVFHIDWITAKYFSNGWALGLEGYVYDQLTGDSGSGATLGNYKDYIFSLGPVTRYASTVWGVPASVEFKILPRIIAINAPNGTALWLSFNLSFTGQKEKDQKKHISFVPNNRQYI